MLTSDDLGSAAITDQGSFVNSMVSSQLFNFQSIHLSENATRRSKGQDMIQLLFLDDVSTPTHMPDKESPPDARWETKLDRVFSTDACPGLGLFPLPEHAGKLGDLVARSPHT